MSKLFYLYVKTHNKTGLKYLGKTEKNPNNYKGSGLYWLRHLKQHGNDISTEIIGAFNTLNDLKFAAKFWSQKWNIVESKEWANLIEETGNDGGSSSAQKLQNIKRVANGTHNFLNGKIQRQTQLKRLADGTHHFLNKKFHRNRQLKRMANGEILPICDSKFQHNLQKKRLENGTHPSQVIRICPYCSKKGQAPGIFKWHFNRCKNYNSCRSCGSA